MVKKIAILLAVGAVVFGFLFRNELKSLFLSGQRSSNTSEVKLLFRTDPTLSELTAELLENGVISSESKFLSAVKESDIDTSNFAAGKYIILSGTKMHDLVNGFVKGENGQGAAEVKVNVLFNRCIDIPDVGSNISKCIVADSASLVDFILSNETLNKYGFTAEQIPAMFIAKKYEMYFDTDAEAFVEFMAAEFRSFWNAERMQKLKKIGLTSPSQAVTLASIVYMEQSRVPEEWPIIAKLYLNRIDRGIPLEADPTFKFCWPDRLKGVERLLNVHRDKDCPYNTYIYKGIPPGPICLPPYDVVEAVLNPADVDYIFLCGDGTGHHNFASTNAEHNKNVAKYRVWLKEYLKKQNS